MGSPRPSSRLGARVGLAAAAVVVGPGLAEALLRVGRWSGGEALQAVLNEVPPDFYTPDPRLIWRHAPGQSTTLDLIESHTSLRTNALGLRGPEVSGRSPGLLCLGDSFTFAAQVDENQTACAVAARALSTAGASPLEPLNAGVSAYGAARAVRLGRELAPSLNVQRIVLFVYLGNDLVNDAQYLGGIDPVPFGAGAGAAPPASPATRAFLTQAAGLSRLAALGLSVWQQARPDPSIVHLLQAELAPFAGPDALAATLPHTRRALHELVQLCQQARVPCVVALIPPAWAVHPERLAPTAALAGVDPEDLDPARVAHAVGGAVPRSPRLAVVDLTVPLQQQASDLLYFRFDPHWTAAAHRIAGQEVATALGRLSAR